MSGNVTGCTCPQQRLSTGRAFAHDPDCPTLATIPLAQEDARQEFELSDEQHTRILEASRPVPYLRIRGMALASPQENANRAWRVLGREMGFDYMTVRPVPGKDDRFFTAVLSPGRSPLATQLAAVRAELEAAREALQDIAHYAPGQTEKEER